MKKVLILCLILAVMGTGCTEKAKTKTSAGADAPWIAAYFAVAEEQEGKARQLQLIDVDFDGIPELFLFKNESTETTKYIDNIYQCYSYKNGAVSQISLPEHTKWTQLKLCKSKENGKLVWLTDSLYMTGSHGECSKDLVDFSDFSNVKQTALLEWTEEQSKDASGKSQTEYYRMPDKTQVTKQQLDEAIKELSAKYQIQKAFNLGSAMGYLDQFTPDGSVSRLDKDLFYPFARLYDETIQENSEKKDDPDYLYVNFITNRLTTGNRGNVETPLVSVIRKAYEMPKGLRGSFWINQISVLKDPDVQKSLNEKLKSLALSELTKDKNIRNVHIKQDAGIYKDYLSVCQEVRYLDEKTGKNKVYYKDVAYNLETGKDAKLSDLVSFDAKLKDKIYAGEFSSKRFTHEECLKQGIYDKLWNMMKNPDLKNKFFMSDYDCSFIIDVAPEDSFCFRFTLVDLMNYIH